MHSMVKSGQHLAYSDGCTPERPQEILEGAALDDAMHATLASNSSSSGLYHAVCGGLDTSRRVHCVARAMSVVLSLLC